MKRKLFYISVAIIILTAAIATGTLAYYTIEKTIPGNTNMHGLDFILHEYDADGKEIEVNSKVYDVLPGNTYDLTVVAENIKEEPMFLRIKINPTLKPVDQIKIPNSEMKKAKEKIGKVLEYKINTKAWTYKDGYYYYNNILDVEETTEPLLTGLSFDRNFMSNEYRGIAISLDFDAQAVQSVHNTENALTASGWGTN